MVIHSASDVGHKRLYVLITSTIIIWHGHFIWTVGGSFDQDVNASKCAITPSTQWAQVKEILGDCGRAAIQTQGSTSNLFGSTFIYGYPHVAFEVMKNGYISTVTLFQS